MVQVLLDENMSPHPPQLDTLNTMKEKMSEIKNRTEFAGETPRTVFHSRLFRMPIRICRYFTTEAASDLFDSNFYMGMGASNSPLPNKHTDSALGRILSLSASLCSESQDNGRTYE